MILNKIPKAFYPESVYSDFNEFDLNVKDYCKSSRQNGSKLEPRASKMIIIGNVGTGKSCLVQRFVHNSFSKDYKATIGVDFEVEQFEILGMPFNLQIWDTAGQERFKCIASAYYRGAQCIVVAFDLANRESLINSEVWLLDALKVLRYDDETPLIFLVGTKRDLLQPIELESSEIDKMAIDMAFRLNAEYWPVSSLTGENVSNFFSRIATLLFNKSIRREIQTDENKSFNTRIIGESFTNDLNITINEKKTTVDDLFEKNKCC